MFRSTSWFACYRTSLDSYASVVLRLVGRGVDGSLTLTRICRGRRIDKDVHVIGTKDGDSLCSSIAFHRVSLSSPQSLFAESRAALHCIARRCSHSCSTGLTSTVQLPSRTIATMGKKGKAPKGRAGAKKKAQKGGNANSSPWQNQFQPRSNAFVDDDGMYHGPLRSLLPHAPC